MRAWSGLIGLALASAANAAPLIELVPPLQVRVAGVDAIEITVRARAPVETLVMTVLDAEGRAVGRIQRHHLDAGEQRVRWREPRVAELAPGHYRIEVEARFGGRPDEVEHAVLRLVAAPRRPPAVGVVAPAVEYRAPGYRLDGALERVFRDDRRGGERIHESRLRVHWASAGVLDSDLTLDAYRRTGLATRLANSRARVAASWDGGEVRMVLRSAMPAADDPLRLFADFRIDSDRRGIALRQRAGRVELLALAADGRSAAGGRQSVWAGRATMPIGARLRTGISVALDDRRRSVNPGADSRALGVDAALDLGRGQRIEWQSAFARGRDGQRARGGPGHRLVWRYRRSPALALRAGVLRLSPRFFATLADPGDQVTSNASGPEGGVDVLLRGAGGWWRDLRVAVNAFAYRARDGAAGRDQVDALAQLALSRGDRVVLGLRTRRQDRRRESRYNVATTHPLSASATARSRWSRSRSTSGAVDRAEFALRRGTPGRWSETTLELLRRHGGPADAVSEVGVGLRGHRRGFDYQWFARRTRGGAERGLNLFARVALGQRWLHRYHGELWLALGDRAAVRTAGQVETGLRLRF